MTKRVYEVPAPRQIDVTGVNRTVQELNRQLASLQAQLDAQAAQIAALTSDTAPTVTNETTINQVTNVSGGGGGGGGSTSPGGTTGSVQYNDTGAFAGTDATAMQIGINALSRPRLIIGGDVDPTAAFVPGGLVPFVLEHDFNAIGGTPGATFPLWTISDEPEGSLVLGLHGGGSLASPTAAPDSARALTLQGGVWNADDELQSNIAGIHINMDGANTSGVPLGTIFFLIAETDMGRLAGNGLWTFGENHSVGAGRVDILPNNTEPGLVVRHRESATENMTEWRDGVGSTVLSAVDVNGAYHPPSLADADAQNNSIYLSTDTGNLSYKDSGGTAYDFDLVNPR